MLAAIARIGVAASDLDLIIHGTTTADNTMIELTGAKTGLLVTKGFKDVLEIGRQYRTNVYDLRDFGRPAPLVERDLRLEPDEVLDHFAWADAPDGDVLLKRIAMRGGVTIVQDPETAESPTMPRSAPNRRRHNASSSTTTRSAS